MDKKTIAKNINKVAKQLTRTIVTNHKLNLRVGEEYNNQDRIESWSDERCTMNFEPAIDGYYTYIFYAYDVPCHEVDYENEEECEILGAIDCEDEGECLVLPNVRFKIVDVANDLDFEEMGYYAVELERNK